MIATAVGAALISIAAAAVATAAATATVTAAVAAALIAKSAVIACNCVGGSVFSGLKDIFKHSSFSRRKVPAGAREFER